MTDNNKTMGLLYLSYGTPRSEEEIIPYLFGVVNLANRSFPPSRGAMTS